MKSFTVKLCDALPMRNVVLLRVGVGETELAMYAIEFEAAPHAPKIVAATLRAQRALCILKTHRVIELVAMAVAHTQPRLGTITATMTVIDIGARVTILMMVESPRAA